MKTYVIIIFIISILISFVLEKNNRRFIIYSFTTLKKYFDEKMYNQKKDFYEELYDQKKDLYNIHNKLKDDLKSYVKKEELDSYEYASLYGLDRDDLRDKLKDFINYTFKNKRGTLPSNDNVGKGTLQSNDNVGKGTLQSNDNVGIGASQDLNKIDESSKNIINTEKYKILSKIVDAIVGDYKKDNKDNKSITINELYDIYRPNWYK
jgi:hypothetical protein